CRICVSSAPPPHRAYPLSLHDALPISTVLDDQGALKGLFTDGDLRRSLDKGIDIHTVTIDEIMTRKCRTVHQDMLAAEALNIMRSEEHTSELQSRENLVCRLLLEKKQK